MEMDSKKRAFGTRGPSLHLAVLAAAALTACAHAPIAQVPPHETEAIDMTTQQVNPADQSQAPLSAENALLKVLEIIRTGKSVGDITPERLTELAGRPVGFDGKRYGVGGVLTKEWAGGFEVSPNALGGPLFSFSFEPIALGTSPPATDICTIDFDAFSSELEKLGYKKEIRYGEHGRILSYPFINGVFAIDVIVEGEDNTPMEKLRHLCVRSVEVR